MDYRDDDQTAGTCPRCGKRLSNLTVALTGYCEDHGWVPADFGDTNEQEDDDDR